MSLTKLGRFGGINHHYRRMAFKTVPPEEQIPSDPEHLHRLLAPEIGAPTALWAHQADVLREWHGNYLRAKDIAIELPTGSGKTLVGGLIGEFRRRTHGDRVVYVCPTRQLAQQSFDKLKSYGIPVVLLVGPNRQWNRSDAAKYTSADAIAVTVYHHVFNSNPALEDANCLILDDAHAAESAVAGTWTLNIERELPIYQDILSSLSKAFAPSVLTRLRNDQFNPQVEFNVFLASPVGVAKQAHELEDLFAAAAAASSLPDSVSYAYKTMNGRLECCMVYASHRRIQIRPLIPPTDFHPAFNDPVQRVYMSATLGTGGEIERVFGRRKIDRIPTPKGWDHQGTGTRFFCFPELTDDLSISETKCDEWVAGEIERRGRVVVMAPDQRSAEKFRSNRIPSNILEVSAQDVESDLSVFTSAEHAALILANRYDGIDLPDDACRLVIITGLPSRGDLQERFLYEAIGAFEVLQERVRARIVQGAGRATRNLNDFAIVMMLGTELIRYCLRREVLFAMHPQVQAEIQFGLDESQDSSSANMQENIESFIAQSDAWREVEQRIHIARDKITRKDPAGSAELESSAQYEVSAWQAAWHGNWELALKNARQALDALAGDRIPQRYAALWYYLASCWANRIADRTDSSELRLTSAQFYRSARAAGRGTTWLTHLQSPSEETERSLADAEPDPLDLIAATNILDALLTLGKSNRFDEEVSQSRTGLIGTEPDAFENALTYLGRLAGANPSESDGGRTAAPDSTWIFGKEMWVCWEAKSDAKPIGEIGVNDARQASGHLRFAAADRNEISPSSSLTVLTTPQGRAHPSTRAVTEDTVYVVTPSDVLNLFDAQVRVWRSLRPIGANASTTFVLEKLKAEQALPSQWSAKLRIQPLSTFGS